MKDLETLRRNADVLALEIRKLAHLRLLADGVLTADNFDVEWAKGYGEMMFAEAMTAWKMLIGVPVEELQPERRIWSRPATLWDHVKMKLGLTYREDRLYLAEFVTYPKFMEKIKRHNGRIVVGVREQKGASSDWSDDE